MRHTRFAGLLVAGLVIAAASFAQADGWGTIKGQAVFADKPNPAPALKVDKNQDHCLKNGDILSEQYVINAKNKGVKWVVVYLAKDDDGKVDFKAKLPIHPGLNAIGKPVVMDQPCCRFEPHVVVVRKGQDFIAKNSSPITHNSNVQGKNGPNVNPVLTAGKEITIPAADWKPDQLPVTVSCGVHGWMKGYVFCMDHPYFAVTDEDGNFEIKNAPAGKYRLVAWQEGMGWVAGDKSPGKNGKAITIEDGKTTEVKLSVKYDE